MGITLHLPTRCVFGLLVAMATIIIVTSDDQFLCCMKGITKIRGIVICPAPCCAGYEERGIYASKLARITYCQKEPRKLELDLMDGNDEADTTSEYYRYARS